MGLIRDGLGLIVFFSLPLFCLYFAGWKSTSENQVLHRFFALFLIHLVGSNIILYIILSSYIELDPAESSQGIGLGLVFIWGVIFLITFAVYIIKNFLKKKN